MSDISELKAEASGAGLPPLVGPADRAAHGAHAAASAEMVGDRLRAAAPSEMKRRGFFTDMPDRGLFIVFAGVGFVAIFAAKQMRIPSTWVAIIAVADLIAYALLAFRMDRFKANPDGLGDNCYYMGFLFTLASLSSALISIQADAARDSADLIEELIGSFGVSLFSTIGGITLRVVFMQMRREIADLEEQLRSELQNSARLLKDQLAMAVADLESLRLRTTEVLSHQVEEAADGLRRMADGFAQRVSEAGTAYSAATGQITAAADGFAVQAERVLVRTGEIEKACGDSAAALRDAADGAVAEIGKLVRRVDQIEVPPDLLTRQVKGAMTRLQGLASAIGKSTEAAEQRQAAIGEAAKALDGLIAGLARATPLAAIEASVARLDAGIEGTAVKIEGMGERLDRYSGALATVAEAAECQPASKKDPLSASKRDPFRCGLCR